MKHSSFRMIAAALLWLPASWAQAAITCTVSSPGFSTTYNPAAVTQTVVQSSVTVTCQRNLAGDPTSQSYSVGVDNGLYFSAGSNRASFGTSYVRYETYRESSCVTSWKTSPGNGARVPVPPPGTLTLSGYVPTTVNINVWVCIPAAQAGVAAGTHLDTVGMTLYAGTSNTSLATGTGSVSILVSPTCSISTPPGTITINYASFGPVANANTTIGVTCTSSVPYTLALDVAGGTLLGLNYSLSLSATSALGSGVEQSYSVTGTMVAGQPGTCATAACSASQVHTLIITY